VVDKAVRNIQDKDWERLLWVKKNRLGELGGPDNTCKKNTLMFKSV